MSGSRADTSRPTYLDVLKRATSRSGGAVHSTSKEAVGEVSSKQAKAGEEVTGVGKEAEVPSGQLNEQPQRGEGERAVGQAGTVPHKQADEQRDEQPNEQPDEQPEGVETEGVETEGEMRDPLVVIGFPNKLAITREPLVSVVNPDGFSMVSKTELAKHFLPEGWTGTIVLKLERSVGDYIRMSPGLDPEATDLLWSLGPGEYMMEVAEARAHRGGMRGGGSGRGAPRVQCSSVPSAVARSVRTGYLSAATSFASGFGGKKFASKKAMESEEGGKSKPGNERVEKEKGRSLNEEKSGINIGSSSERRSKQVDWGRGWSKRVGQSGEEEVSSKLGKREESERREVGKTAEDSPLDEWARGVLKEGKRKEVSRKKMLEKEVVEKMEEAWGRERGEEEEKKEEREEKREEEREERREEEKGKKEERRGNVTEGVLLSERILATNRLKVLLNRVKCERVEALEGPVDGDRVLLMSAANYTSRGVRDGRYWGKGQTTSMKTENGAAVRSWRCGGGRKCENAECGFKKKFGVQNVSGIETRGNTKEWVCFYCNEKVKEPEVECQAMKWTIRNEEEVAYCHMGTHNHDLGKLESSVEKEAHQMQVRM